MFLGGLGLTDIRRKFRFWIASIPLYFTKVVSHDRFVASLVLDFTRWASFNGLERLRLSDVWCTLAEMSTAIVKLSAK